MPTTQERVVRILLSGSRPERFSPAAQQLFTELQELTLADLGISSVEAQALLHRVADEFGVSIPDEDARSFTSFQDLTDYLDARA